MTPTPAQERALRILYDCYPRSGRTIAGASGTVQLDPSRFSPSPVINGKAATALEHAGYVKTWPGGIAASSRRYLALTTRGKDVAIFGPDQLEASARPL